MRSIRALKIVGLLLCYVVVNLSAAPTHIDNNDVLDKTLTFQDCGSVYDILRLSISGCNTAPCQMPLGSSVTVNAEFNDYGEDVHVLKHDAYWVLNAVNTKAFVTPDACDGKNCPFRGFEGMAFQANLLVNATLPALRGNLFWEVYNQFSERVMCYKIPISLTY